MKTRPRDTFKRSSPCGFFATALLMLSCVPGRAVTFTNNTSIGLGNTNYDSLDIVISNCTVTVDGPHTFNGLLVAAGAVLTHSFWPAGTVTNLLPVTKEQEVLQSNNPVTLVESNVLESSVSVTDTTGTMLYTNGADYLLSSTNGIWTQIQRTTNSTIPDGATVLVSYDSVLATAPAGLTLTISGSVQVLSGATIAANGIGYGGGIGPGAGSSLGSPAAGAGGSYGGLGGPSSSGGTFNGTYGTIYSPTNLGSGGGDSYAGPGAAGGGLIAISAGGSVTIAGSVVANGGNATNGRAGGGAGGSIWLSGVTLSGSGLISANGGSGDPTHGGGGGGGRIGLQFSSSSFTGPATAYGGTGATIGGAGTIYTLAAGNGLLVLDNGGQAGTNTTLTISDSAVSVVIQGKAAVTPTAPWTVGNLTVSSNGTMLAGSLTALSVSAAGVLTVESGGRILASGAGYGPGQGLGAGSYLFLEQGNQTLFLCSGGGYGGNGGAASGSPNPAGPSGRGGATYGTQAFPSNFGSGGGTYPSYSVGGSGGGAILLTSLGGLVQVNGTIAANGLSGSVGAGGGGAGGTISIIGGSLIGSGTITAAGGNGGNSLAGGGGGGRILLNPSSNLFFGTVSAYGGSGANWGGAGTLLISGAGQNPQLILDNGGNLGTNTPVQSAAGTDLMVRGGAVGTASGAVSFANLYIAPNSWLVPFNVNLQNPAPTLNVTVTANATIQAGGGVVADLAGYTTGGLGAGRYSQNGNACSGAGHGGYGGISFGGYSAGGSTYDTITGPTQPGSGGGFGAGAVGGPGGGVVRLTVTGTLELDGVITANGGNGLATGGGGSGGSLWMSAGTLSGAGSISANGGNGGSGAGGGGGGGGGMIFLSGANNSFVGTITAFGGTGANAGGAGTQTTQFGTIVGQPPTQLILDNGGNRGAATPVPNSFGIALTIRNGAVGTLPNSGTFNLGPVLISSNAWLAVTNLYFTTLSCSTLTIQPGGGITADAGGSPANQGSGAGHSSVTAPDYPGSGAGHGGWGGASSGNLVSGGTAYDSATSPNVVGSGGGGYASYSIGGAGGGGLALNVSGLLQLDGLISANGGNGSGLGGGGGSGGSLRINGGTLAGAGTIRANGGAGANGIGGGGGGGCIALNPTTYSFAGTISAYGGSGANWGGAGTVYIAPSGQPPQLIVDNGGQAGASTPFSIVSSSTALTLRNGAVAYAQTPSQTLGGLLIASNALLVATNAAGLNLTVNGNAILEPGGGIAADSFISGGPGVGHSSATSGFPCSGAGYGGTGADCTNDLALGGTAYGSITFPNNNGSGGGGFGGTSIGGLGGGNFHLTVSGTLDVSGKISASGGNGSGEGGGGGSGGSITLSAGTFLGAGTIAANGGSGVPGQGGGGGGGRVAITYTSSSFAGSLSAHGGGGAFIGGAGTIYTRANSQTVGQVLVDNGGLIGTSTPVSAALGAPSQPFNLTIQGSAMVSPQNSSTIFPQLANLTIVSNGFLVGVSAPAGPATLDVLVWSNADIQPGGVMNADGLGYAQQSGPGAGISLGGFGSGAGYGGIGGASAATNGGPTYGSTILPTDFGSGGGFGEGPTAGGSSGGGAVRLSVAGVLTVDGLLSAEGQAGIQDESGGGSGGSVLVEAGILAGSGRFAADGGLGQLYYGGGGAGGRLAFYSRTNAFLGQASANGGAGDFVGGTGTIVTSNSVPTLQIISSAPTGVVTNEVSLVDLYFSFPPNPASVTSNVFSLTTPNGPLPTGLVSLTMVSFEHYQASFPAQTAVGAYALAVSTNVTDIYGQPMAPYTSGFVINLPVVQGTITDTNGLAVAGVLLQASSGFSPATTGTNGSYALGFVPGSTFTVTPSLGSLVFVPPSISYTNATLSISNQNYLAVTTLATVLATTSTATNLTLSWQPIPGVTYQVFASSNLFNWFPYGPSLTGTNTLQTVISTAPNPEMFFRVSASD